MSGAPFRPATSPCVGVCAMDRTSGYCTGCGRTIREIAAWGAMSEAERLETMTRLPARLVAIENDATERKPS